MARAWTHLIRFIAEEDGQTHLGQIDIAKYPDVGLAHFQQERIECNVIHGSVYDGLVQDQVLHVARLLSPFVPDQVPTIRCLGLNYRDHAKEARMEIPSHPVLFIKPRTSLNGPFPATINIPKIAQDETADYEAELSFVIGKDGRDIPKSEAMDYVLGYTASNDVSARTEQLRNSQWCFGKGFDGFCPIGPLLVRANAIQDPHKLQVQAIHNHSIVQNTNTQEMIFDIPTVISFLSQGTTLERGTIIMTGTGPGIGMTRTPRVVLRHGDDMRVYIDKIGTLINRINYE